MISFFAAGLCSKTIAALTPAQSDHLTALVETLCEKGLEVAPNCNSEGVRYMAHTMEPLRVIHRPLITYAWSHYVALLTKVIITMAGFQYRNNGALNYWYRPGKTTKDNIEAAEETKPIPYVFLHGLGLGLAPYLHFLLQLRTHVTSRGSDLYVLEMPYVAMRLAAQVPSMDSKAAAIQTMLKRDGYEKANFIGHSFGTLVLARLCKIHSEVVASGTFVDPICFLLFLPDVLKNFIYSSPKCAKDWTRYLLCSRELYTQYTLCRNFWWYQLTLFAHEFPPNMSVFLSENDNIIPVTAVKEYLRENQFRVKHIEVFHEADHGQFIANFTWQAAILESALEEAAEGCVVTNTIEFDEIVIESPKIQTCDGDENVSQQMKNVLQNDVKKSISFEADAQPVKNAFPDKTLRRRSSRIATYRISRGCPEEVKSEIVVDGLSAKARRRQSTPAVLGMRSLGSKGSGGLGGIQSSRGSATNFALENMRTLSDGSLDEADENQSGQDPKHTDYATGDLDRESPSSSDEEGCKSALMAPKLKLHRQGSVICTEPCKADHISRGVFMLASLAEGFRTKSSQLVVTMYLVFTSLHEFLAPRLIFAANLGPVMYDCGMFTYRLVYNIWADWQMSGSEKLMKTSRSMTAWSASNENLIESFEVTKESEAGALARRENEPADLIHFVQGENSDGEESAAHMCDSLRASDELSETQTGIRKRHVVSHEQDSVPGALHSGGGT